MLNAQIKQIALMDKSRWVLPFKVGDLVYLNAKNIKFDTPNKFAPKYVGPYRILELHAHGNAARLELPDTFKARCIHDVFNVSLLKRAVDLPLDLGPVVVAVHHDAVVLIVVSTPLEVAGVLCTSPAAAVVVVVAVAEVRSPTCAPVSACMKNKPNTLQVRF
jgi:hypothetical protein